MSDSSKVPVAVLEYEPSGFEQTLLKHRTKLILVGVLALVATGSFWGYRLYKEASHKSASVDFVRAGTISELKAVAEKHSGKPSGGDALILAADQLSAERPGEAVDLLKDFLGKYPDHPLRDLAAFRIAEYFVLSGDAGSAEKEYTEVVKANSPYSSLAQLRLGDMKWAAGDTAKAQEYYEAILKSTSTSAAAVRPIAKDRLDHGLKTRPPALVEYKAEAPTPGAKGFDNIGLGNLNDPGAGSGEVILPPSGVAPFDPTLPPETSAPGPGEVTPPAPAAGAAPSPVPPLAPAGTKPAPAPAGSAKPATPPAATAPAPTNKPAVPPAATAPASAPKPAAPQTPADGKKVP